MIGPGRSFMEFAVLYRWRDSVTAADVRQARRLFLAWKPPVGVELKCHYFFASGGGIIVADAAAAASLFEAFSPFMPSIKFSIEPVFNAMEAIAISMDIDASGLSPYCLSRRMARTPAGDFPVRRPGPEFFSTESFSCCAICQDRLTRRRQPASSWRVSAETVDCQ